MTPLPPLPEYHVVLVKPDFGISTGWAFSHFKPGERLLRPDNLGMCQAIRKGDRKTIESGLVNVFEPGTFEAYPLLGKIKKDFTRLGADGCLMSGSGPTMYGLFRDRDKAEEVREHFRTLYRETYLAGTC
ncbi:hypothetical protein J0B03_06625 [Alkalibacter rhizosphaerae]|uniref:GHMP kinase C-terminal domain-containing protein n=1 Tax=Alkalibacter rhizosphaerae TaxID=2815577 RepID=A0A974XCX1_9FIRM|nr:hypothetical protein [Alkalibacter rhizosphaerae]QSX07513.1 hypothetical protein J0B03_06625 [Alkalibacter rhizosphaerae]